MATGPVDDAATSPQAERDDLARRCADAERRAYDAEQRADRLAAELADARARIAEQQSAAGPISLFEGGDRPSTLTGDGSDPRVVSLVFGATAVVAAMVTLLALLNGNLFTPFGVVMVLITIGLAIAAAKTRVTPTEVTVTRGVVYVERAGTTYRFDLRADATQVDVDGRPGDPGWQVRFARRGMDPFVIDAGMVDPASFLAQLREHRPAL